MIIKNWNNKKANIDWRGIFLHKCVTIHPYRKCKLGSRTSGQIKLERKLPKQALLEFGSWAKFPDPCSRGQGREPEKIAHGSGCLGILQAGIVGGLCWVIGWVKGQWRFPAPVWFVIMWCTAFCLSGSSLPHIVAQIQPNRNYHVLVKNPLRV